MSPLPANMANKVREIYTIIRASYISNKLHRSAEFCIEQVKKVFVLERIDKLV